jgi:putative secretion ATPase (PEP-CTERM system associated)
MVESHFGFTAAPFQLSPDPNFYFESRGHGQAMAYLKFGAFQGEGFIVVTGEIGAGKTTLVRALLEGLDANQVVAAQIVNTQLDSLGLLQSICSAFGIPHDNASKAQLLGSLEAFFIALSLKGKRALLVVDEAQNLGQAEIEELRMLSNFQLGNKALLQSFLVGQPELRGMLQSRAMEQLRQRVIASCHLGPMSNEETRAYIKHRLRHVGWTGQPHIDYAAFAEIHRRTDGMPRRINLLCARLLLSAFLTAKDVITLQEVKEIATEMSDEIGCAVLGHRSAPVA